MISQNDFDILIKSLKEKNVQLVAVSKFQPLDKITRLYDWGQRAFGENYVQEMAEKHGQLPQDIEWHFIGHLQSNKVKYIAPFVHLIQSVDSFKLLMEINKQALKNERIIDVLLQVYVGREETKYGLDEKETLELLTNWEMQGDQLGHVRIRGLMGMATNTSDMSIVAHDFTEIEALFSNMKQQFFYSKEDFDTLCIGMSSDYLLAIEKGSNMVRIGSSVFGSRPQ